MWSQWYCHSMDWASPSEEAVVTGCACLDLDSFGTIGSRDITVAAFAPTGDFAGRLLAANHKDGLTEQFLEIGVNLR